MNRQKSIREFEEKQMKSRIPDFNVGDTVDVHVRIVEEGKKRTQVFEGVVIKKRGSGIRRTFTVRKVSYNEGVERTFPVSSPNIEKVVVTKKGSVRRAKLYYIRKRIGKRTKIEGEDVYNEDASPSDAALRKEGAEEGV